MTNHRNDWMDTVRMICFAVNIAAFIWLSALILMGYVK